MIKASDLVILIGTSVCCAGTVAACNPLTEEEGSLSDAGSYGDDLTDCHGQVSTEVPRDGTYYLTTFGGPGDYQDMFCGGNSREGGYYAADAQRFGCGTRIIISGCGAVVAEVRDRGPDVCVEQAAGGPVIDVSPLVAKCLHHLCSVGWSEKIPVSVQVVPKETPLGPSPDPNRPCSD